ncbi:transmembrane protein 33-like [Lineus longissimus]|uniref:transmembrane protein 33-like n=1 Tax=Lineus longissimus TaxID=88925 RepID=UPI002B4DC54B
MPISENENNDATSDPAGDGGTASSSSNGSGGTPPPQQGGYNFQAVKEHMMANKVEAALWGTRVFTVFSAIFFMIPLLGNQMSFYQRSLISSAATSALRLHQRLPNFQLNREFFGLLFMEDSCHYLLFALIFINSHPVTLALIPVFLFALLHATNFTKVILDKLGPNSLQTLRNLITKLELQQRSILRFIACTEIFLMPAIIIMIFTGRSSILLPFVYYRFLTLRYASRRNPYSRQLFYEMRVVVHQLVSKPQCPGFISSLCFKVMDIICKLAPQVAPDAARAQ